MQRDAGVTQVRIASSLLNIEELFRTDLQSLAPEQEAALRRIARSAPVDSEELQDSFSRELIQSLIDKRLIVRVGHKYDIYWDIFRDYLNTGLLPAQENYVLRMQVGSVSNALNILAAKQGPVSVAEFISDSKLTGKTLYNILRDMRLLGLVDFKSEVIVPRIALPVDAVSSPLTKSVFSPAGQRRPARPGRPPCRPQRSRQAGSRRPAA